jgi:hypothetical protein
VREITSAAFQIRENPITSFRPQTGDLIGEKPLVIHICLRIENRFGLTLKVSGRMIVDLNQ